MIRTAIVDDQALVRAGIRALLERSDDITVVGEAADGASGVALAAEHLPDVVLMDIRMPAMDGLEAARRIVADERLTGVHVLMLTTFDTDEYLFDAIQAGAAGFVLKDTGPDELRRAVRVVAAGEALLSPTVTRRVMDAAASRPRPRHDTALAGLTAREREVLVEVASGKSNGEIAQHLHLSPDTVRTYVSRLLGKLHARDRAQLVVIAFHNGLATPTP